MKFSVLMTTYIGETAENIDEALKSILVDQTVVPDQVVLVYDGEVKKSLEEVVDRYKNLFPNILEIVRLNENQGQSKASAEGFKYIKYEWFARMDSDDISVSDRFAKQLDIIDANPDLSVVGGFISEFKEKVGDTESIRVVPEKHDDIVKTFKKRTPVNNVSAMLRKSAVEQAGGYGRDTVNEDYSLYAHMWIEGCEFYNIQEVLVNVRVGNGMVSRRGGFRLFKDWCKDQRYLRKNGKHSLFTSWVSCFKCLVFVMSPAFIKRFLYRTALRKKAK